jgi:hypothetical protein
MGVPKIVDPNMRVEFGGVSCGNPDVLAEP